MAYAAAAISARSSASYNNRSVVPISTAAFARLKRPNSVSIRIPSGSQVQPKEIFDICQNIFEINPVSVAKGNKGDILVTTNNPAEKTKILKFSTVKTNAGDTLGIFDPSNIIAFVNVYSVPFELHDDAVVRKLMRYGTVHSIRRGHHAEMPGCENGARHLRMHLHKNIPSFIHFGSESFRVRYTGQPETCRRCDQHGHTVAQCQRSRCFNCNMMDHNFTSCKLNRICAICGSARHDITECVEWTPHEEDFDDLGMDFDSQANEGENSGNKKESEEKPDEDIDEVEERNDDEVDDGNLADNDGEDEDDATDIEGDKKTPEASTLASDTVEEPTPSEPPSSAPANPFANIAFAPTPPATTFTFTPSQSLFTPTPTPSFPEESLEDIFSKIPPKIFLDPPQNQASINPTTEEPKPQRPPRKTTSKPIPPPKPSKPNHPADTDKAIQSDASTSSKRAHGESSGSSTVGSVIENRQNKKSSARPPKKKTEKSFVSRITNKFNSSKD